MEAPVRTQIDVPNHLDPREAYVNYMFFPGRFSTHAIIKALKVCGGRGKIVYIILHDPLHNFCHPMYIYCYETVMH